MAEAHVSTQQTRLLTPAYVLRTVCSGAVILAVVMLVGLHGDVAAMGGYLSKLGDRYRHPHWPDLAPLLAAQPAIKVHVATVLAAAALALVQVTGAKGTRTHRVLGWVWVLFMLGTAVATLFIHQVNRGGFSFLHGFIAYVLITTPLAVWAVRRGKINMHAKLMTGIVFGAILFAGAGAFLPGRIMWQIFFR